jgi:hypothetical protein
LKLGEPIEKALAEQPIVTSAISACVVARAAGQKHEGAELFVNPDGESSDREKKTVRLLLRTESLLKQSELLSFLRHEFYHIVDMLDPAFGYEPFLPPAEGGPTHDSLLRERYRTLWDTAIDGRMVQRGWLPESCRDQHLADFARPFPMLGEETERIFSVYFHKEPHTHAQFVAFAQSPWVAAAKEAISHQLGSRCPLCAFPTYAFAPELEKLSDKVIAEIQSDFPNWQIAQGLCVQCADLYCAHQLSASAAMALPGVISPASSV